MSYRINVFLHTGPKKEFQSPALADEDKQEQFAYLRSAQEKGGTELTDLPWLSVRKGLIASVHIEEIPEPIMPRMG